MEESPAMTARKNPIKKMADMVKSLKLLYGRFRKQFVKSARIDGKAALIPMAARRQLRNSCCLKMKQQQTDFANAEESPCPVKSGRVQN